MDAGGWRWSTKRTVRDWPLRSTKRRLARNCNYSQSTIWSEDSRRHVQYRPAAGQALDRGRHGSPMIDEPCRVRALIAQCGARCEAPDPGADGVEEDYANADTIFPDASRTFDRFRPITTVDHMLEAIGKLGEETHALRGGDRLHDMDWGWGFGTDPLRIAGIGSQ